MQSPRSGNSTGNARFSSIPRADIPRSAFDRSKTVKTAFDENYLIPIYVDEALPGDTISLRTNFFARMATPLRPVMDNMYLDIFYFAIPNRILQENWARLMGERKPDPDSSIDFLTPKTSPPPGGYLKNTLQDYMALPTGDVGAFTHNTYPLRAYNLVWNEWFRDENLQDSVHFDFDDGPDDPADYVLLKRGKRKDYFTGALPFASKGDPVELPLGTSAPITGTIVGGGTPLFDLGSNANAPLRSPAGAATQQVEWTKSSGSTAGDLTWGDPALDASGLIADLSSATSATINAIRLAFQTQRFFERDARGGTRLTELLKSHFGVTSPDQRLQRPEYLGGGSTRINIHPVAFTSQISGKVGDLASYATAASSGIGFNKSFTEHAVILGLASVRADLTYQYGLDRMWSRSTRFDFFWPVFQGLGEQEILNKELYVADDGLNDETFGYQERYGEYRYAPSKITGTFRSNAAGSFDFWHLAQEFGNRPLLNASFIEENVPIDRIVAVPAEPHFLFDAFFRVNHVRPMSAYGVPGLVDHF